MTSSYALITGASKGIGKSMAEILARKGYGLLLVARSAAELQQVADDLTKRHKVPVDFLSIDLTESEAAKKLRDWCETNKYDVSILINNAGYGLFGNFEALSLQDQTNMMQLNMLTLVQLTHLFIPVLKRHPQSFILNVASTAAYQAIPTLSLYSATKAFVLSFSRGLRYELKNSPIAVSCLSPGPVDTNFFARAGLGALKSIADNLKMQPDKVAEMAIAGMFKKKAEIIPGLLNTFSATSNRFLPKSIIESVAARFFKEK
ncbi:SDR family NAD(P)-dependent oxidoreductase [Adhaeribacter aquaticus]|uniref:SDR family NAD(P)-dependent oxidoreductase n=1 Tax=Adhaeribacter aquaticus TaxID=299567 RepID=UPI0004131A13|nr:SDR family oxidoreductase [Adhaeribacter aquaticus]